MGVKRFGDWSEAESLLTNGFRQRLALAIRQATIKNALLLVREIKREFAEIKLTFHTIEASHDQPTQHQIRIVNKITGFELQIETVHFATPEQRGHPHRGCHRSGPPQHVTHQGGQQGGRSGGRMGFGEDDF